MFFLNIFDFILFVLRVWKDLSVQIWPNKSRDCDLNLVELFNFGLFYLKVQTARCQFTRVLETSTIIKVQLTHSLATSNKSSCKSSISLRIICNRFCEMILTWYVNIKQEIESIDRFNLFVEITLLQTWFWVSTLHRPGCSRRRPGCNTKKTKSR